MVGAGASFDLFDWWRPGSVGGGFDDADAEGPAYAVRPRLVSEDQRGGRCDAAYSCHGATSFPRLTLLLVADIRNG